MERTYYIAKLTIFYDSAAAQTPVSACLEMEKHDTRERDIDGPGHDYVAKMYGPMDVSLDEPLLSDPRWEEWHGRDSIEERADDGSGEPNYWLEYQVRDGVDYEGDPTYACRDWILPLFNAVAEFYKETPPPSRLN